MAGFNVDTSKVEKAVDSVGFGDGPSLVFLWSPVARQCCSIIDFKGAHTPEIFRKGHPGILHSSNPCHRTIGL